MFALNFSTLLSLVVFCVLQITAIESGGPEAVLKLETELGAKTCLPRIIKAGYRGLQLIHFFTAGEQIVKAWTIRVRVRLALFRGGGCLQAVCMDALKGLALRLPVARDSLWRDRAASGGFTSPVFHACGSASPFQRLLL